MTQKGRKLIVVSDANYDSLKSLGTITDSFDSVISKLLKEKEKRGSSK